MTTEVQNGTTSVSLPVSIVPDERGDYQARIALSDIEVDEDFNARQGPDAYRNIEELADSLDKVGQQQNLTVMPNKKGADKPFFLIAGFRRNRAFHAILKRTKAKDVMVNVLVKNFEGDRFDEKLIEARYANLATDGGTDPLRDYEYAARCHYFHSKLGASAKKIASFIGKPVNVVHAYLALFDKLTPEVRAVWAAAPDPTKEIPLSRLKSWSTRNPAEQKALCESYVSGSDEPVYEGGERGGQENGKGDKDPEADGKSRIDGKRPSPNVLRKQLSAVKERLETEKLGKVEEAELRMVSKTLRYVLGEISRIF